MRRIVDESAAVRYRAIGVIRKVTRRKKREGESKKEKENCNLVLF